MESSKNFFEELSRIVAETGLNVIVSVNIAEHPVNRDIIHKKSHCDAVEKIALGSNSKSQLPAFAADTRSKRAVKNADKWNRYHFEGNLLKLAFERQWIQVDIDGYASAKAIADAISEMLLCKHDTAMKHILKAERLGWLKAVKRGNNKFIAIKTDAIDENVNQPQPKNSTDVTTINFLDDDNSSTQSHD